MSGIGKRAEYTLKSSQQHPCLAVKFAWIGDRYEHYIAAWIEDREIIIARSAEAAAANSQRELPTFQEMSLESIGGADVLCLVGMSGRTYWSASVESTTEGSGVKFDLSCKSTAEPQLECEYEVTRPVCMGRQGEALIELDDQWTCVMTIEPVSADRGSLILNLDRLTAIGPPPSKQRSSPLRCKHQWRLLNRDNAV